MSPEDKEDWNRYLDELREQSEKHRDEELLEEAYTPAKLTPADWWWIGMWSVLAFVIAVVTLL